MLVADRRRLISKVRLLWRGLPTSHGRLDLSVSDCSMPWVKSQWRGVATSMSATPILWWRGPSTSPGRQTSIRSPETDGRNIWPDRPRSGSTREPIEEITCEEMLQVAAKEAVVVYSQKEGTSIGPAAHRAWPDALHAAAWRVAAHLRLACLGGGVAGRRQSSQGTGLPEALVDARPDVPRRDRRPHRRRRRARPSG